MDTYPTPTPEQAQKLREAVRDQDQARSRLISSVGPAEQQAWASRYLQATDRCYTAACEIGPRPA
jgi:hypothetical protein